MEHVDYSKVKLLLIQYGEKFFPSTVVNTSEKDYFIEMKNIISTVDSISKEIVSLVNELINSDDEFTLDKDGFVSWRGRRVQLGQANPNVPIQQEKLGNAYTQNENNFSLDEATKLKEEKLERLAKEFYQLAHRVLKIGVDNLKLDKLKRCGSHGVSIVRNKLIEHPEASGVTHNTFAYNKFEGPQVKGLRINNQLQNIDKGFKSNSEEFILDLSRAVEATFKVLQKDR